MIKILQFLNHFRRQEFSSKERIMTPLFFALVVIILFSFTFTDTPQESKTTLFIAQTLIAGMFAVQLTLARAFETESNDRVFDMLRVMSQDLTAFTIAKLIHVTWVSSLVVIIVSVFSSVMNNGGLSDLLSPTVAFMLFGVIQGLSALGVLLATVTLKSRSGQTLFAILFFPLAAPLIIATSEVMQSSLEGASSDGIMQWYTIVIAFCIVFTTFAIMLASESNSD